jgi:hypothetical protein
MNFAKDAVILLIFALCFEITAMEKDKIAPQEEAAEQKESAAPAQERAEIQLCFCQEAIDSNAATTLSCSHTFHTLCIENCFKSLLISTDRAPLTCPFCRTAANEADRAKLNLEILFDDILAYNWGRFLGILDDDSTGFISSNFLSMVSSVEFSQQLQIMSNSTDEERSKLIELLKKLEITPQGLLGGIFVAQVRSLCNDAQPHHVRQLIEFLLAKYNITDQAIADTLQDFSGRAADEIRPVLHPWISLIRYCARHPSTPPADLQDNPLIAIAQRVNWKKVPPIIASQGFKALLQVLNSQHALLKELPRIGQYGALMAMEGLFLYLFDSAAFERMLNETRDRIFPLPINDDDFARMSAVITVALESDRTPNRETIVQMIAQVLAENHDLIAHFSRIFSTLISQEHQLVHEENRDDGEQRPIEAAEPQPSLPVQSIASPLRVIQSHEQRDLAGPFDNQEDESPVLRARQATPIDFGLRAPQILPVGRHAIINQFNIHLTSLVETLDRPIRARHALTAFVAGMIMVLLLQNTFG